MKNSCLEEFFAHIPHIIPDNCIGYDVTFDCVSVGMEFLISPNFAFPNSTDEFTIDNALLSNWYIKNTICHYSDKFVILKIRRKSSKSGNSFIRVKNLRTNVDFDLFNDLDGIENTDTIKLFFI